jgi:hypothetical protein
VNGSYEFLAPLTRLIKAYQRFEMVIAALNAAIISIAIYALAQFFGLPAFMSFYWQDFLPLAASPVIISVILGFAGAMRIKRRRRPDLFPLLGPELSEKARTAYDNREVDSLPMQSLARDLKASISKIRPSEIFNRRQISTRATMAVVLSGITIFIAQSQISADITPADLQSLSDLRDRAMGVFQNETPSQVSKTNLTGNLYGKPSLAVLNEDKMELMLYPGIGAGSRARSTEPVERAFQPSPAGEAAAVPSELYIESLPPENKEIIKRYFTILSQTPQS